MAPVDPSPSCEWLLLHGLGRLPVARRPEPTGNRHIHSGEDRFRVAEGRSRADGGPSRPEMGDPYGREGERAGSIGG